MRPQKKLQLKLVYILEGARSNYLHIAGDWRDHITFVKENPALNKLINRTYHLNPLKPHPQQLSFFFMASGIIYLIIIAMWAAYFLPQWFSSHEDASGKSIDRYKNAMQVVAENQSVKKMEDSLIDKSNVNFSA
jgi:hypothetical protein